LPNQIVGKLTKGSEVIIGTDQDDYISPLGGSDYIDGKKGFDTVYVYWPSTKFKITTVQGTTYLDAISGASSSDSVSLRNVEQVEFSDKILSLEIPDTYANTSGSDAYDGGLGIDTVSYSGKASEYLISRSGAKIIVDSVNQSEGKDALTDIERLQFKDVNFAFDLDGHAGTAVKTLGLVFGTAATAVPMFVGICLNYLEARNFSAAQLMHEALAIRLGPDAQVPEKVVAFLYQALTGVAPTAAEQNFYVNWIHKGDYSIDGLAVFASELSLNPISVQLTGLATSGVAFEMPL
jgi:hypothetical protein